jgi:hypothetical protein
LVAVDEAQPIDLVGVSEQQVRRVRGELWVMVGAAAAAHGGEAGDVVAAAPAAGPEVVDLEAGTAGTPGRNDSISESGSGIPAISAGPSNGTCTVKWNLGGVTASTCA